MKVISFSIPAFVYKWEASFSFLTKFFPAFVYKWEASFSFLTKFVFCRTFVGLAFPLAIGSHPICSSKPNPTPPSISFSPSPPSHVSGWPLRSPHPSSRHFGRCELISPPASQLKQGAKEHAVQSALYKASHADWSERERERKREREREKMCVCVCAYLCSLQWSREKITISLSGRTPWEIEGFEGGVTVTQATG